MYGFGTFNMGNANIIPQSGLMAYWNSALTASYPGSGNTWYDISGNGNDMTLSGSYSYVAASSSIKITSGANTAKAYTPSDISSTLNGTGSSISVVQMMKFPQSEIYNYPTSFYLGGTTASGGTLMVNYDQNNYTPGKIGLANGTYSSLGLTAAQALVSTATGNTNINYWSVPPAAYTTNWSGWAFLVYIKQDSNATYPTHYNNVQMYAAGWWNAANDTTAILSLTNFSYIDPTPSTSKYGMALSYGSTGNIPFNLQQSKYYLGANPLDSDVGGMYLGAQAIYNKALTVDEINSILGTWTQYYRLTR
jgi:hypothetical protein